METEWKDSSSSGGDGGGDDSRRLNSNLINNAWDIWDINTNHVVTNHVDTRYYCNNGSITEPSVIHALLFGQVTDNTAFHGGDVRWKSLRHGVRDPHMMCLKLGKRHYCEDAAVVSDRHVVAESSSAAKRAGIPPYSCYVSDNSRVASTTANRLPAIKVASPTRCQVEGCHVALGSAKEYYRRHKVCEMHSKSPKVLVLGLQQRFCQQCSRFHEVTEFDEAKRSCRRRLKGHNLRRRKGTLSNSPPPNFTHSHENNSMMKQQLGQVSTIPSSPILSLSSSESKPVCALSLLSSPKMETWISSGDLSARCSAALYELIVANRATSTSGHLPNQNSSSQPIRDDTMHISHDTQMWDRICHSTMSLDLKQAPALDIGLWSMKEKSKDQEEWTDYCWSDFGGSNVL